MEKKQRSIRYQPGSAVILAGLIILIIGIYYEVVKAGIPYQDPPLELQIQYAINSGVGDELCKIGFFTIITGLALGLIRRLTAGKPESK